MKYFWDSLEEYGDRPALVSEQESIGYRQLSQLCDAIVKDIPERSFAFLVCTNQAASIAGYLALLRKRVAAVLVSSSIDGELFDRLNRVYQPQYIWCPDSFLKERGCCCYGGYKLISTGNDCPEMNEDLAVLVTTSGSTGSPKLVRLSYRNLQSNTQAIVDYLGITPEDRAITTLPMSYVYGLSIIQTHLLAGASIAVTGKSFFDSGFWDFFKTTGVTTFGSVPTIYQMLEKMNFLDMDLPSLKVVTQAGGSLGKDLHFRLAKGLAEKGKRFVAMYGAAEATARMTYVPSDVAIEKAGSIGIPIPGGTCELIDSNGVVIKEDGKVGELVYYGRNVMLGYATCRADLSKEDELHGRLATGDLAKRDHDGFYSVAGRKNRFVKVFGNRVSLSELEELLRLNGYPSACVGEDDRIRIYTTSGNSAEIIDYISKKTGLGAIAFAAIPVEQLPLSESGKVLYSKLK